MLFSFTFHLFCPRIIFLIQRHNSNDDIYKIRTHLKRNEKGVCQSESYWETEDMFEWTIIWGSFIYKGTIYIGVGEVEDNHKAEWSNLRLVICYYIVTTLTFEGMRGKLVAWLCAVGHIEAALTGPVIFSYENSHLSWPCTEEARRFTISLILHLPPISSCWFLLDEISWRLVDQGLYIVQSE